MLQRTIKKKMEIIGIGLHKGVPVKMLLEPTPEDSGIVFYREDLGVTIPLSHTNVISTQNATTVSKDGASIHTIEHLLSALYAYGIDNLKITLNNEETPILDGSSVGFCMLLDEAGITKQNADKEIIAIKKPIEVTDGHKYARLIPSKIPAFDYTIDFTHPIIKKQHYLFDFSSTAYKKEIAKARTFGFLKEVQYLRSQGLALGGSLENAIVLDDKKVLNPEGLRFKDEFVRHKILDAIGDLFLAGRPIFGKYEAFAGSHKLNYLLVKAMFETKDAFEILKPQEARQEFIQTYTKSFA